MVVLYLIFIFIITFLSVLTFSIMSTYYFYNEYVINVIFQKQSLKVVFGAVVAIATVLFFLSRWTPFSLAQYPGTGRPRDSVYSGWATSVPVVSDCLSLSTWLGKPLTCHHSRKVLGCTCNSSNSPRFLGPQKRHRTSLSTRKDWHGTVGS